mmetsp:Transcript_20486/g.27677  ORF Transcript_20486/g.27677 Transcript_20486/m.27677 type:complete len:119 (-) Transcript_20486:2410-2766(-)
MPSLTKASGIAKNHTTSVSRAGATRMNRIEHSSLVHDQASNEMTVAPKAYNSRSRVRHPSIIAANGDPNENHSLQVLPGNKPSTVKGSSKEHMYLSKNVSRVKKRLELTQDRGLKMPT